MARLKSEDKRNAILSAATALFAERGLNAPTSAITAVAGIAEGTLFTYFGTKDELINALYRDIKMDLAAAMMSSFPRKASVRNRLLHVWDRYVDWGTGDTAQQRVLKQIEVWSGLTEESKTAGMGPFLEIKAVVDDAIAHHILRSLPERFLAASMSTLAEMTMELIRQDPAQATIYRTAGFEMFWAGAVRKA
jgi:AcrR family transcriptional regulator